MTGKLTAPPGRAMPAWQRSAAAIAAALAGAGTRWVFGAPGGGPNLDVVVIVVNDATLSLIKIKQNAEGHGGPAAVGYRPASFAAAVTAMGASGVGAGDVAGLTSALAAALDRAGPTVIDDRTGPSGYPAVMELTRGEAGRRGSPGPRQASVMPAGW